MIARKSHYHKFDLQYGHEFQCTQTSRLSFKLQGLPLTRKGRYLLNSRYIVYESKCYSYRRLQPSCREVFVLTLRVSDMRYQFWVNNSAFCSCCSKPVNISPVVKGQRELVLTCSTAYFSIHKYMLLPLSDHLLTGYAKLSMVIGDLVKEQPIKKEYVLLQQPDHLGTGPWSDTSFLKWTKLCAILSTKCFPRISKGVFDGLGHIYHQGS